MLKTLPATYYGPDHLIDVAKRAAADTTATASAGHLELLSKKLADAVMRLEGLAARIETATTALYGARPQSADPDGRPAPAETPGLGQGLIAQTHRGADRVLDLIDRCHSRLAQL